ncbi:hypothetical protein [Endozoicomonas sp. 4G]|uniref:hypothetical protein n=1 Tax=Endozoicomonas sp. 4G TaxID=2872754 RepID=UPI002078BB69|nr:hypothetical protein [Endozoicomonas sp. 4G]
MKILSSLLLALVLPFCCSLWAENDQIRADSLLPYDPQEYDALEEGGVVSERNRREARRGSSSSGGGSKGSGSKGSANKWGGHRWGGNKGGGHRGSVRKVTNYIKSLASGARVKLTKFMKGYSLTTSKKISVSVNPLGRSLRGTQPINKIESKVRFQSKESGFLYYTLRGYLLREALFHLVLIGDPEDSSRLYLGYYEEDEDSVIDTAISRSTAPPVYLQDVLNKSDTPVPNGANTNSTALPPQSSNDTFINANLTSHNTTGSQGLMPKRGERKPFKPILSLEKDQDYSIEVAWKSKSEITSVAMSDTSTMTYATINPSPTQSLSPHSSSIASSTRQILPDASAAIPENVGTQIIIKDKAGMTLATLNLDLEPSYFSFSDENGYLLEYRIDGSEIHQLTKIHTETEYEYGGRNVPPTKSDDLTNSIIMVATIPFGTAVVLLGMVALVVYCPYHRSPKGYENP